MQTGSSRKQWFIAARIRNKLMHMLVGNTPKHKSWRQTHRIQENILKIGSLNVGGVQQSTKRQRINCLDLEIIVLSETHLQSHLEHSESHLFQSFVCSWGLNPDQRHFAGTAVLARKEKFWSVQSLSWTSEHPYFRFHQDGCLTAVQLWTGHGGICIVVYGIYGPSGARWEKSKWQYFNSIFIPCCRQLNMIGSKEDKSLVS
jgi:exonuclease III